MITSFIEINGCKHYIINEGGYKRVFFIHSPFMIEEDVDLKHPLGCVYKPKGCIDTQIRFVRQPNNSVLLFRKHEWNVPNNPFYVQKKAIRFNSFLQGLWQELEYKTV